MSIETFSLRRLLSWLDSVPVLIAACAWLCFLSGIARAQQTNLNEPNRLELQSEAAAVAKVTSLDPVFISCDSLYEQTPETIDVSGRLSGNDLQSTQARRSSDSERAFILLGHCLVRQGKKQMTAEKIVLWKTIERRPAGNIERLIVYAKGNVQLTGQARQTKPLLVELITSREVEMLSRSTPPQQAGSPDHVTALLREGRQARQKSAGELIAQLDHHSPPAQQPMLGPMIDFDSLYTTPKSVTGRHVTVSPRSFGIGINVESFPSENRTPAEQVTIISQGVNIVIEGVSEAQGIPVGTLDISADQAVIWTEANADGSFKLEMFQDSNAPLRIYLEGNIEVRQGNIVTKASRAYYDIREDRGILLDSELRMHMPEMDGDIRLRAGRIRQLSHESFHAENAWVSASEFGVPTYRIESDDIFLENRYDRGWLGKGDAKIDPQTGLRTSKPRPWITSLNNRLRLGEVPVFASPFLSGPAEAPHIPLQSITFGQDRILGTQLKTKWDMPSLLGLETSSGLDWKMNANVYTDRGFWLGNSVNYMGIEPIGSPGSFFGESEAVWINDFGQDNLGRDRRNLDVASNTRGRVLWRHRQQLSNSFSVTGEVGFLSDRNFLEQYYENEWDRGKDNETLLNLNYQNDNVAASLMTRAQVNDFEYDTQWLPKGKFTILGEPLLWDRLVYSSSSSAGYGQLKPGVAPTDPNDLFVPLWYAPSAEGAVLTTRHQLAAPFNLGAIKVNPYVLGEAAYWQDDGFTNNSLQRYYGSAGVSASLMLSKYFPDIQSRIFNLNGLAHKQVIGVDYYYADSSQDLANVPQYNEFDENSQERFRTRLLFNSFGLLNSTLLPGQFDPRRYAVRTGAARNVSSPYFELVDDQQVMRMTWNHRLQTKVGPPDRQRIKDWMRLDLGMSYFPNANDDNFGESLGLLTANYVWDIGNRTKILANSQFDFFDNSPQVWDVGFLTQRSTRGSIYLGYRQLQAGPIDSQLLTASTSYAMSPKWIATFGTAYDIAERQDRGQSLTITGIRSDFMISLGFSVDSSKGNVGIGFMIEPFLGKRDASSNQLSSLLRPRTQ